MSSKPRFMATYFRNNGKLLGSLMLGLVLFWIIVLIVLPQLSMLDYSFRYNLPPAQQGGPQDVYNLDNYRHLIFGAQGSGEGYNVVDLQVFVRTIIAAMVVTVFDLILCYPLAYYLGQSRGSGFMRLLVVLLIIPYWINEILRAFALHYFWR
jgi:spermidine/putrescine transport system permease protein